MKRSFISVAIALSLGLSALAQEAVEPSLRKDAGQDYPELNSFIDSAKFLSTLFRGKEAQKYSMPTNGHVYWSSPKFSIGNIFFEGKLYKGVVLNINAFNQDVLVRQSDILVAIAIPPEQVDWLTMDETLFVNLNKQHPELPRGVYEVLYSGKCALYKRVVKSFNSSVQSVNGNLIGYDDPLYRNDVYDYFEYRSSIYYCSPDGVISRIKNKKALRKRYPDKKREIRQFTREIANKDSFRDLGKYCTEMLKYIENE